MASKQYFPGKMESLVYGTLDKLLKDIFVQFIELVPEEILIDGIDKSERLQKLFEEYLEVWIEKMNDVLFPNLRDGEVHISENHENDNVIKMDVEIARAFDVSFTKKTKEHKDNE